MGHNLKSALLSVVIIIFVLSLSDRGFAFNSSERLIGTYYFYWYDIHSGSHIVDPDGTDALTDHPPDEYLPSFSHKDIIWHKRELLDMIDVGIM